MRWVDKPVVTPKTCAVIPGRGERSGDRFLDTGNEILGIDPHIYISEAGCRQVAQKLGWYPPEELEALEEALAASEGAVQELEAENDRLEGWMQAVDTLESADFRARKKTGRPKKTEEKV